MFFSKKVRLTLLLLFFIALPSYFYYQNNAIETSHYSFTHENIPESFDGFTIAQVSDLHNKDFRGRLSEEVATHEPDIIAVTGDVIDRNRTDIDTAIEALEELIDIAPVYFVSGNHEVASGVYPELLEQMLDIGVVDLDDDFNVIEREGSTIGLLGIQDPLFFTYEEIQMEGSSGRLIINRLEELKEASNTSYNILLSHRAELMEIYAQTDIDLALTGHAHGGQIRLPFVNGLFAPTQGFLPEYTSGVYEQDNTAMVVSRGLGNSAFPLRINNRPELVIVTLESDSSQR
ncbi:Ser/Thr protein phosphatase family protein [Alkalibacterium sp. AK22]|uniref:metallophosphoesterase n=1 Tax=Alkalibacterium sp. AK22 TaxID=1229520 RepID=UPI0004474976|nr:metallophosphoesterase [Alkalibacterium sp. AK22]EXJ23760.1 Ser/Thr protein phosphatase family protein [Alkalibacterium sp. AK22]